jgi:hypothetical protein
MKYPSKKVIVLLRVGTLRLQRLLDDVVTDIVRDGDGKYACQTGNGSTTAI